MVELNKDLLELLNADAVMPHEVAAQLSGIAGNLCNKYPDFFMALNIGGSTVSGAAAARSILLNIDPCVAISDIDYAVILSREITSIDREFLHKDITRQLEKYHLSSCPIFNAENVYLVIDEPYNMAKRMSETKNNKPLDGASYLATRLLIPFGVIFPFSGKKQMQNTVNESLNELAKKDPAYEKEIKRAMNCILDQRRKIKEKHIQDEEVREFLIQQRNPSSIHF